MPLHPSPGNIIKFITLLSPFILTSYLVLESFFRQDLKGLIFLAGGFLASFIGLLMRLLFKSRRPLEPSPGCNIFELSILELNQYTNSNIRDSRDINYNLNFLSGNKKLKEIENCEVINLENKNQDLIKIKDLL